MALQDKTTIVSFNYGSAQTTAGMISFDSTKQAIYVGDGDSAMLVSSNVKDASFADSTLTITKIDGSNIVLDFGDVASAKATMKVFEALEQSIATEVTNRTNADASIREEFAAADSSLSDRLDAVEASIGEISSDISETIQNAIGELDSTQSGTDSSSFVTVNVTLTDGKLAEGAIAVTTNDIAKASELATVKATANAAATKEELTAHTGNSDIHVTSELKSKWDNTSAQLATFLADASISGPAIDTLKEIQDYITSDGSAAADMLAAIEDVSTLAASAKQKADQAQSEVDAVEGRVGVIEGDYLKSADKTELQGEIADASSAAFASAQSYAQSLKVNNKAFGIAGSITLSGEDVKVGGEGGHTSSTVSAAIEDLYVQVGQAVASGVKTFAVADDSSKYASVNASSGSVTLTINKVNIASAQAETTGVADAYDVKTSIESAKTAIIGTTNDASNLNTVNAAKKYAKEYADAEIAKSVLKWNVIE